MKYYFLFLYFQSVLIFQSEMGLWKAACVLVLFFKNLLNHLLPFFLVGAFIPFTVKGIIDGYAVIAILLIVFLMLFIYF